MMQLLSMVRMRKADRMAEERRWAEAYKLYREAAINLLDRLLAAACWQDAAVAAGQLARYPEQADCSRRSLSLLHGMKRNTPLVRRTRIRALLALAEALYRSGDLAGGEQAVRHVFGLAAEKDPDITADCFHRLGQVLLLQGEIGGALTAFARAAERARSCPVPGCRGARPGTGEPGPRRQHGGRQRHRPGLRERGRAAGPDLHRARAHPSAGIRRQFPGACAAA